MQRERTTTRKCDAERPFCRGHFEGTVDSHARSPMPTPRNAQGAVLILTSYLIRRLWSERNRQEQPNAAGSVPVSCQSPKGFDSKLVS